MKLLHDKIHTGNLNLYFNAVLHQEFFRRMDYDWWQKVQPGDTVLDIGACVGMFCCHAFDLGADKVYAVEPSLELLETANRNVFPKVVNNKDHVFIPINKAITNDKEYVNVFNDSEFTTTTFPELISEYGIEKIDYLKCDCEGGEYSIFTGENLDWIINNVGHIALEVHISNDETQPQRFIDFRNEFLYNLPSNWRIQFMNEKLRAAIQDDEWVKDQYPFTGKEWGFFMIYITNLDWNK